MMFYRMYRDQIVCEDNLVYYRMSWFLLLETILFGIWAANLNRSQDHDQVNVTRIVCVLGLAGCVTISLGVTAAQDAIYFLKECYEKNYPGGSPDSRLPLIIGKKGHHWRGKSSQYIFIGIAAIGWGWAFLDYGKPRDFLQDGRSWLRQHAPAASAPR